MRCRRVDAGCDDPCTYVARVRLVRRKIIQTAAVAVIDLNASNDFLASLSLRGCQPVSINRRFRVRAHHCAILRNDGCF